MASSAPRSACVTGEPSGFSVASVLRRQCARATSPPARAASTITSRTLSTPAFYTGESWQSARGSATVSGAGKEDAMLERVVPRLSATPGAIAWLGPALGVHNEEIYCGRLGLSREDLAALGQKGVI